MSRASEVLVVSITIGVASCFIASDTESSGPGDDTPFETVTRSVSDGIPGIDANVNVPLTSTFD